MGECATLRLGDLVRSGGSADLPEGARTVDRSHLPSTVAHRLGPPVRFCGAGESGDGVPAHRHAHPRRVPTSPAGRINNEMDQPGGGASLRREARVPRSGRRRRLGCHVGIRHARNHFRIRAAWSYTACGGGGACGALRRSPHRGPARPVTLPSAPAGIRHVEMAIRARLRLCRGGHVGSGLAATPLPGIARCLARVCGPARARARVCPARSPTHRGTLYLPRVRGLAGVDRGRDPPWLARRGCRR
jgi:hypothetical protein